MSETTAKIDWSNGFLRPVDITLDRGGLTLSTLGENVRFDGAVFAADTEAQVTTNIRVEGCTLVPECTALSDGVMEEYHYFEGLWSGFTEMEIAQTSMSGIGVFLRCEKTSFFLSFDFPYSKIECSGSKATIGCDPLDRLTAGEGYRPHTLTVGAAALTGVRVGKFDRAEIEAFSEYILSRMPAHFRGERPIHSATCITNRMTDVRDGRIFYSMADNPTLTLDPETIKQEIRLCAELGIEYYQVFEGFYDWEEDGSTERHLREIIELAESLGVRVGDYMTALELNCWHYNYYDRHIDDPEMCALLEEDYRNGADHRHYLCYGSDKTVQFLKETVVESIRRNREQMICLDGNAALPCFDTSHGHNAGSLYAHIRGLVEVMSTMNATSPYFMTWSNAGNWLEFMPKLLWYNQNVYLTDPHPRAYSATLNNLKYYGDCRREQMVTVHNKYFVPYCLFTNCEYYAFRHSRVDDAEFFEYSFLQGLAVTPNICLGELRTFLERTSSKRLPYVKDFMKKWLSFIRDNMDCWKNVFQLADAPGTGANEIYAHMNGDRGFICLVNQNQSTQRAVFTLDRSIGLCGAADSRYLLSEIYPRECPLAEQRLPGALYGDTLTLDVPANAVRFVKIEPYSEPERIRLYGIGGRMTAAGNGFVCEISAGSGLDIPVAVYAPEGVGELSVETAWNVPKYWFASSLSDIAACGCAARFRLHMPRERFDREIACWSVNGSREQYRLTQAVSDFCGGYIHNFYKEDQKVLLRIGSTENGQFADGVCAYDTVCAAPAPSPLEGLPLPPVRKADCYETTLDIPFIEWPATSCLYGFDEVLELVFSDSVLVGGIRAFIDENPVPVYEYRYPPAPTMKSFYIELTGEVKSGTHPALRIEVDWNGGAVREAFRQGDTKAGAQVVGQ